MTNTTYDFNQFLIRLTGNHRNIFNDARVPWSEYRYYDPRTVGLDFDGMVVDIKVMNFLSDAGA